MSRILASLPLVFAAACQPSTEPDPIRPADTATPAPTVDQAPLGDRIAALEGLWVGQADPTPLGPMAFAFDFGWDDDRLVAHTDGGGGLYIELAFQETEDGWVCIEEGGLPGGLVQSYPLHPTALDDGQISWAYAEDPDYLSMEMSDGEDRLVLDVTIRSSRHVVIDLGRM